MYKIIIGLLFILFVSCDSENEFFEHTVNDFEPELGLSGFVCNDSIYACLTFTKKRQFRTIYEPAIYEETITDTSVKITIWEDGSFFCDLMPMSSSRNAYVNDSLIQITTNYYVGFKEIKLDSEYTLKTYHPLYGKIEALTTMPVMPAIIFDTSLMFKETKLLVDFDPERQYKDTLLWHTTFSLRINDNPGVDNYYMLEIDNLSKNSHYYSRQGFSFDDVIIEYDYRNDNQNRFSGYLFSDRYFDGETYNLQFSYFTDCSDSVSVNIYTLSKDLYLYYLTLNNYWMSLYDPFSKPVIVFSNTTNNIGIWGGISKQTFKNFY